MRKTNAAAEKVLMYETIYDTEFIIFVGYQPFSGGKLIMNSLGLADNACLQHFLLAHQQLKNNFTQEDKKKFLVEKLKASNYFWDDLGLGCHNLFGIPPQFFHEPNASPSPFKVKLIQALIEKKIYFFKALHVYNNDAILSKWTNGKILTYTNSLHITKKRLSPLINFFSDEEVLKNDVRSTEILENLNRKYDIWDCFWFDEKEKYLLEVENLYDKFKLTNYNKEILGTIYDLYMKAWNYNIQYLNEYNEDF